MITIAYSVEEASVLQEKGYTVVRVIDVRHAGNFLPANLQFIMQSPSEECTHEWRILSRSAFGAEPQKWAFYCIHNPQHVLALVDGKAIPIEI